MKQNGGGKGSAARPLALPLEEFGEKHDAIFGARKRTNGGWTPPPIRSDGQFLKTNTRMLGVESDAPSTDKATDTEDWMVKSDVDTIITIDSMSELEKS